MNDQPKHDVLLKEIKRLPALNRLEDAELQDLMKISKIVTHGPGAKIITEGGYEGWIYYLITGRVRIEKGGKELVTLYRTGDVFGEMGVIDSSARSASVTALEKTTCLAVNISMLEDHDSTDRFAFRYILFRGFAEVLAKRLRITTEKYIAVREELMRVKQDGQF